jgi:hypothetical protein
LLKAIIKLGEVYNRPMKKMFLSVYLFASLITMGQAIKFGRLGCGFDHNGNQINRFNPVRCLFNDTINNVLYAGGQFKFADGKIVYGIARWHDNMWDSLKGGSKIIYGDRNQCLKKQS